MTGPSAFLGTALPYLDWAGVAVFATSGALLAAAKKQTLVTLIFFAVVTGVGGGTARDLLIGAPVFWVHANGHLIICFAAALAVWLSPGKLWEGRALDWLDAAGLAAYATFGAAKGLAFGLAPLPAVAMGVLTACLGGIIRDVLAGEPSLGDPEQPLADCVRDLVEERTGTRPDGPVHQLTQLRTLGHCFNPVSFYYCFDADDRMTAAVAEVTNTPWGERHAYVIEGAGGSVIRGGSAKQLHVSPFMDMDQRYSWSVAEPGETVSVHIENHRGGDKVFDATLSLRRRKLTTAALLRRYPLGAIRVLALIYAQALRLKLRGVPVHPHPGAST